MIDSTNSFGKKHYGSAWTSLSHMEFFAFLMVCWWSCTRALSGETIVTITGAKVVSEIYLLPRFFQSRRDSIRSFLLCMLDWKFRIFICFVGIMASKWDTDPHEKRH